MIEVCHTKRSVFLPEFSDALFQNWDGEPFRDVTFICIQSSASTQAVLLTKVMLVIQISFTVQPIS